MFRCPHHRRLASFVALRRLLLPLPAIVIATIAASADAAIVTSRSMSDGMSVSAAEGEHHRPQQQWLSFLHQLNHPELYGLTQHSTGTTSSPTSSTVSGSTSSALAGSSVVRVC